MSAEVSSALFLTETFQLDNYFFKTSRTVVFSPPFALELVIHSIISTSCQEGHPAVKIPLDGGERGRPDPWALLQNSQSFITALLSSAGSISYQDC